MPSFQTSLTPSRRAATRFVSKVRRGLLKALVDANDDAPLTQADLARSIGVHRSVINRELRGRADITVGRIGELAWAMGLEPTIVFRSLAAARGNVRGVQPPARTATIQPTAGTEWPAAEPPAALEQAPKLELMEA